METKSRSVILSGVSSLLAPTFGHIYVGRPLRGFTILAFGFLMLILCGWIGASTSLWSFYTTQAIYLIVVFILAIDAMLIARKSKNYELKRYNKWYFYIPSVLVILLVLNVFMANRGRIVGFDNHRNVSMNMAPTLLAGDLIATDTRQYAVGHTPERGEIITFKYPKDTSIIYVKRVIGLPGENISIKGGSLYINGEEIAEPYIQDNSNVRPYSQYMDEKKIPEGHVFVLGDNRDNSNDSRFWGMLPISKITGKVTLIWYALDTSRINKL